MRDAPHLAVPERLFVDPATGREWVKDCPLCGDMHPVTREDGIPFVPCPRAPTEHN